MTVVRLTSSVHGVVVSLVVAISSSPSLKSRLDGSSILSVRKYILHSFFALVNECCKFVMSSIMVSQLSLRSCAAVLVL